ncbi:Galactoside-binding soluble lectin 13 [Myotis brandtii]|uniref:Galectin n=1 Tax=Myotis brandtii TaxID=109478 RepID=S7PWN0_MYOBR|nr:Galactoside-binding soluble lectin 13 [Myotis brandtii]
MEYLPVLYKKNVSISVGSSVKINGTPIMPFCMTPELQVDFFIGTNEDSDIAFSLRVYFGKELVMNSRQGGKWGPEVKYTDMPFRDGQPLEVYISVLSNEYQSTLCLYCMLRSFSKSEQVKISPRALFSRVEKFLCSLTAIVSTYAVIPSVFK